MIKELLYLVIVFAGFPFGIILSSLCKEELQAWKRRFTYIVIASLVLIPIIYVAGFEYKIPIIVALVFIIISLMTMTYVVEHRRVEV